MIVVQQNAPTASTASAQGIDAGSMLQNFVRECGDRPPDSVLALQWLNDRYRRIWTAVPWNWAQKELIVSTAPSITSDSVTLTNGSATVTETTNDGKFTSAIVGRLFRRTGDNAYYTITGYSNSNPDTFTLDRVYDGTSGTALGYRIFQNTYSLTSDVGQILDSVTDLKTGNPVKQVSAKDIDYGFPSHTGAGSPQVWAPMGRDANDIYQIAFYPVPDLTYALNIPYIQFAPYIVGGEAKIVPQVFQSLLKYGWKSEYWGWRSTMDDLTGAEMRNQVAAEMMYEKQLNEMVTRELQNLPPRSLQLGPQYLRARYIRGSAKYLRWDHRGQMP